MVLEALQENRRRRETRETRTTTVQPGSTLARLNPWLDRAAGRATTANAGDSSRSRQRSTSVSRGATSFFTNLYQASRENSNESDSQQDTTLPLAWRSTRQTAARRITRPSDPDSGGDEPAGGGPSATTAAAASRESRVVALARSAWADLHVLYDIGAAAEDPTTESGSGGSGSGRYDRASEVARAAAIGLAAQNDRDERRASPAAIGPLFGNLARDAYTLRRAGIAGLLETAPDPDETAGLSWSDDGRVL